uniref:GDP-mannose 4,6-dehydratase n=1 Tax=viral metagenome TaxID=1070528 RepID=A0A6C0D710_9ZZZZ
MKVAFITGITGQDGSYLGELLLEKGYKVHGFFRRVSLNNSLENIQHILRHPNLTLHNGDMTDCSSLLNTLRKIEYTFNENTTRFEIYNLAAQSHVQRSFEMPGYTLESDGLGPLYLLEAMRHSKYKNITRFYQASTSELFGKVQTYPQTESTPFYPRSPYGVAKLYGFWIVKNYRESYDMYAVNGILFNHESPRRGKDFVTRKITTTLGRMVKGQQKTLELGNLDAKRDWGHAKDYVEGMWRILQADKPEDFVLATNEVHSVREFCEIAFAKKGLTLTWRGSEDKEEGYDQYGNLRIKVNPDYYRPAEVDILCGDATKAETQLGWKRYYSFERLVNEMVENDCK